MDMFGLDPLSHRERDQLFDRLLDDRQWSGLSQAKAPSDATPARKRKTKT
jgi:hypothetical protein